MAKLHCDGGDTSSTLVVTERRVKPEDNTARAQLPRSMEEGLLVVSAAFIGRKRATEFDFRGQADPLSSAGGNKPPSPLKPHVLFCCIYMYLLNFYLFIIDFSQRFSVLPAVFLLSWWGNAPHLERLR